MIIFTVLKQYCLYNWFHRLGEGGYASAYTKCRVFSLQEINFLVEIFTPGKTKNFKHFELS